MSYSPRELADIHLAQQAYLPASISGLVTALLDADSWSTEQLEAWLVVARYCIRQAYMTPGRRELPSSEPPFPLTERVTA